jgi:hypothetical protein
MLLLASAQAEVTTAVETGQISATEAVKLVRDHGQGSAAELERRKEAAKEAGKGKVTAKVAPPKKASAPSRPKVDFVVSCAVVLVNSLDQQQRDDAENGLSVDGIESVDASLLADLIGAVREMRQGSKALDADKQLSMLEDE